ncbi:hypothetical protein DACRYDRAFT_93212 [Dacryopinax primogenitus]|uniref:DUF7918 domain-containing protein n=1 Tax=Dacryopinax primogenitus (strain DJM 731) TaxID=1858805 RepID=M5G7Q9_DACPD|nr:uncharacterized protein DACRYDRAFT_93212 [Dacryopinax primogenitus]EJU04784.1 hypothetical protein DACRYDRAFT_93212 [Dacryopinax primogenitus]
MPDIRNFRAFITVDGEPLPEYKLEFENEGNTVRCWIPSEYGKEFSVHWVDRARVSQTAGYVYVDGEHCGGRFIRPQDRDGHAYLDNRPLDDYTMASFKFGSMVLTDEDQGVEEAHVVKEIGMIRLVVKEGTIGDHYTHNYKAIAHKPVNERMKKVGGHRVVLGAQKSAPQTWKHFHPFKIPPVVFIFQYRPMDLLKAMDIATPELGQARAATPPRRHTPARSSPPRRVKREERLSPARSESEVSSVIKAEQDPDATLVSLSTPVRSATSDKQREPRSAEASSSHGKRGEKRKIEVIDLTLSDDEDDSAAASRTARGSGSSDTSDRPAKKVKMEHIEEERMLASIPKRTRRKSPSTIEVVDLTVSCGARPSPSAVAVVFASKVVPAD